MATSVLLPMLPDPGEVPDGDVHFGVIVPRYPGLKKHTYPCTLPKMKGMEGFIAHFSNLDLDLDDLDSHFMFIRTRGKKMSSVPYLNPELNMSHAERCKRVIIKKEDAHYVMRVFAKVEKGKLIISI